MKYHQKYYLENKEKWTKYRLDNREKRNERARNALVGGESTKYYREHPWLSSYGNTLQRCTNPKNNRYHRYGGRGIELRMKPDDFKFIYHRDKAHNMKRPTIDRIDVNGHYEIENCRYIECSENTRRANARRRNENKRNN